MQTTYKRKYDHKPHYNLHQRLEEKALDFQNPRHPVNQEILKNEGAVNFSAIIKQDMRTLDLFKHIPGLVAFKCILTRKNKIIGEGRGTSVINQMNRYIDKNVRFASNSALIDAFVKGVKTLGTLHAQTTKPEEVSVQMDELYKEKEKEEDKEMITDKQKKYLEQILNSRDMDEDERRDFFSSLSDFSKAEASEAIQKFKS